MAEYLSGYSSKQLYEHIKPDLLNRNYQTAHSLSIEEAIKEVFEITHFKIEDKYEYFKKYTKLIDLTSYGNRQYPKTNFEAFQVSSGVFSCVLTLFKCKLHFKIAL